jgi:hypothetical protein
MNMKGTDVTTVSSQKLLEWSQIPTDLVRANTWTKFEAKPSETTVIPDQVAGYIKLKCRSLI